MTPHSLLAPARLAGQPVLRTQSDERLVDLVRAGYEPAFEAIVTRYRGPLLRYCRRVLSDERAEDAVQQTLVNAYGAIRASNAELNLRPWLYRIAHNASVNALRDHGPRHEQIDERHGEVEEPERAVERGQSLRKVLGAVQALPTRQRDALLLRELEGRSYEEIAGELGVTGGAVRQLLNRARTGVRAGVTAVIPVGLLARTPWSDTEPAAARVPELAGGAGAGAVVAKAAATILMTGAVVGGGAAVLPHGGAKGERTHKNGAAAPSTGGAASVRDLHRGSDSELLRGRGSDGGRRSGRGDDRGDRDGSLDSRGTDGSSGPGSGTREGFDIGDSSGPGAGSVPDADNSGSGSSGSGGSGSDSSGSGSGSSGSGSSGSGSGSSGSGSDLSGSGSGSSGSGSGSSGTSSDLSGSGSGSSGSGSSGSGSVD